MLRKLGRLRAALMGVGWLSWLVTTLHNGALTFWAGYWLFWFFGVFLIPEVFWAFADPANTVSDNTWRFESLNKAHPFDFSQWTPIHWIFGVVYVVFLVRLGFHLIFGLPLWRSWL